MNKKKLNHVLANGVISFGICTIGTSFVNAQVTGTPSTKKYTIPVVVHALYNDAAVNTATMGKVQDALNYLNELYQGKRKAGLIDGMESLQRGLDIEFKLAKVTEDGMATSGYDPIPNADYARDAWRNTYQIGHKYNWNTKKYLNIYVVEDMNGTTGSANMPSEHPYESNYNLVLTDYRTFGTLSGTSKSIWLATETLAHEMGHAMGLKHTFGHNDGAGVRCGDDGIDDTPTTMGIWNNVTPLTPQYFCNNWTNVENVMDYTIHPTMFTKGQLARVEETLNDSVWGRNNLWAAGNLQATGTDIRTLSDGMPNLLSSVIGTQSFYKIDIPLGAPDVFMKLTGGSGNGDLHTATSGDPKTVTWGLHSTGPTNEEIIKFKNGYAGTHYILVDAVGAIDRAVLTVYAATELPKMPHYPWISINLKAGEKRLYKFTVPEGTRSTAKLVFNTNDGNPASGQGDLDIFSAFEMLPNENQANFSSTGQTNTEQITHTNLRPGTYYVLLRGYNGKPVSGAWLKGELFN